MKFQVPTIGGIRKVVQTSGAQSVGTTIAEYGAGTITLAQLKQALGIIAPGTSGSAASSGGVKSAISLGPGLSGGGPLLGNVPIFLTAPIPAFVFGEDAEPGEQGPPGPPGTGGGGGGITFAQVSTITSVRL